MIETVSLNDCSQIFVMVWKKDGLEAGYKVVTRNDCRGFSISTTELNLTKQNKKKSDEKSYE